LLVCTHPECLREYPILDGVPILIGPIRQFVRDQALAILVRSDLSAGLESVLGDCCGPGSDLDALRQQRSTYAWDHWGEFDTDEGPSGERPGGIVRLLEQGLEHAQEGPDLPILDIGASAGRTTFELASRTGRLTLGIDLNFSMLRFAAQVLQTGQVAYDRRRVGVVYDRRTFAVPPDTAENVDFWACDALNLPFAAHAFGLVNCLNVLDSTPSPLGLVQAIAAALAPAGRAILACPYDWSASVTPIENWLGGHSQRGPGAGHSDGLLRNLLTPGAHPQSCSDLRMIYEADHLPWQTRLHARSLVRYLAHLVVVQSLNSGSPSQEPRRQ
jgi:SAM-dependent methyltransferase